MVLGAPGTYIIIIYVVGSELMSSSHLSVDFCLLQETNVSKTCFNKRSRISAAKTININIVMWLTAGTKDPSKASRKATNSATTQAQQILPTK